MIAKDYTLNTPDAHLPFTKADQCWTRWIFQTARNWPDIANIVRTTGIDAIDLDHRKLTELTLEISNLLENTNERGFDLKNIEVQAAILEKMYIFSEHHFAREERLIQQFELPYEEKQKRQHQAFLSILRGAINDFGQGRLTASFNLKGVILEWWVTHINEVDYHTFNQKHMANNIIRSANSWEAIQDIVKSVGIPDLDAEHRQLAVLVLWLVECLKNQQEMKGNLYLTLYQAAATHFQHEEKLIAAHSLPGLEMHREQHNKFLSSIRVFIDDWERSDTHYVSVENLQIILGWWITHINEIDAPCFSFDRISTHVFTAATDWDELSRFIRKTGITRVDHDHEIITTLVLRIDQLASPNHQTNDQQTRTILLDFFDTLTGIVHKHFAHEQLLMESHQSTLRKIHCDDHAKFLQMIADYRNDVAHDRLAISNTLKQYILDWWVNHINNFDYPTFSSLVDEEELS